MFSMRSKKIYQIILKTSSGAQSSDIDTFYRYALFLLWEMHQGCHGQGKISGKWNFFQVREKSGNFVDGQRNLESTWKVREKSGEFENKGLWQAVFRKFINSVQEGKGCTFSWDSLSPSPSILGVTLKGKNLLPWGSKFFHWE